MIAVLAVCTTLGVLLAATAITLLGLHSDGKDQTFESCLVRHILPNLP